MGRIRNFFRPSFAAVVCCACLGAQVLGTKATKDDWEDVNFVFGSAVIADAFPSLLRAAEILRQAPKYSVTLSGHTDSTGPDAVNDALAKARVDSVKAFLIARGVRAEQVKTVAAGSRQPAATNETGEGRFMNRRVSMTMADEKGAPVSPLSLGARIRPVRETQPRPQIPVKLASTDGGAGKCFGLQLGAYRDQKQAEQLGEVLGHSSLEVRLLPTRSTPTWWRVIVGCENDLKNARLLTARLSERNRDAFIGSYERSRSVLARAR